MADSEESEWIERQLEALAGGSDDSRELLNVFGPTWPPGWWNAPRRLRNRISAQWRLRHVVRKAEQAGLEIPDHIIESNSSFFLRRRKR